MRGGYGSSGHGSLHDRIHGSDPSGPPPPPQPPPSPARHCFVDGEPGLLVEWRRGDAGWEGRVIGVAWLEGDGWAVVERWLPAVRIQGCG